MGCLRSLVLVLVSDTVLFYNFIPRFIFPIRHRVGISGEPRFHRQSGGGGRGGVNRPGNALSEMLEDRS